LSEPRHLFQPFFLLVRFHLSVTPTSAHDTLRFSDTDSLSTTRSFQSSPHTVPRSRNTTARRFYFWYESLISQPGAHTLYSQFCMHWTSQKEFWNIWAFRIWIIVHNGKETNVRWHGFFLLSSTGFEEGFEVLVVWRFWSCVPSQSSFLCI